MKDPLLRAGALVAVAFPILANANATAQTPASILDRLPNDATNLLVVRDPLPFVDAVLASPELRAAAAATAKLQTEVLPFALDPARLQRMLLPFRDLVPAEFAIAASPQAVHDFARAATAIMYGVLLQTAGPQLDQASRDKVVANLGAALRDLKPPTFSGWVRFRSERVASRQFDALDDALSARPGLERSSTDVKLDVDLHPALFEHAMLSKALRGIAVDPAPLDAIALHATIELRGDALYFAVGRPADGPLPAASLGRLWRDDPTQLLFARLEVTPARDDLDAVAKLLDGAQWPASANGTVTSLRSGLHAVADLASTTTMRIEVDNGIVQTIEKNLGEGADDLDLATPPDALRRCIAVDDGPFALTGMSLNRALSAQIDTLLDSLAQRADRPEVERVLAQVRSRAKELIEYLQGEESAVFGPGVAIVTRAAKWPGKAPDGTAVDAPFGAVALVAVAHDAAAGKKFVDRMLPLLGKTFGFPTEGLLESRDLGLGAPTAVVALPAWQEAGFELQPHWLQRGELLVLSSDPELTRALLARIDAPVTDAAARTPAHLVHRYACRGAQAAAILDGAAQWLRNADVEPAPALLHTAAALAALVDFESSAELDGHTLRRVNALRLVPRAPK